MAKVVLEIVAGNGVISGGKVAISKGKGVGMARFSVAWKLLKEFKITNVEWKEQGARSVGRTAVGAVAGGIMAGPIGLLLGAAVGARKRDASTAVIYFEDMQPLHVRATAKELEFMLGLITR